jgi:CheY-like chemotaxis protein
VQLESALLNVAINARDAMPHGGTLAFACRAVPSLPAELDAERGQAEEEHEEATEGYVAISISDTGEGMPEAVKERAFEPFFTTKESGRGTGLGLSTVYGFARQSHGAVSLDSAPGAGTTVTLYLPHVEGPEGGVATEEDVDLAASGGVPAGLRVLLVEDDAEVRAVMQRFLASMACETVACADAEEAQRVLAADPGIGLLLTDIWLGAGMRGTELAQAARSLRPGLPVLLMSGYSSDLLDAPRGRELLRKPCTRSELERAMAKALNAAQ